MTHLKSTAHRVVIVGGGFGGLFATQALRRAPLTVTLIDRRNFHLFQPLLYQVATGGLSPANIAAPLRNILKRQQNARVLLGEVVDLDPPARTVRLADQTTVEYDALIVATGVSHNYFGRDDWSARAPGLKTIEDATEIRRRILLAFENAELTRDPAARAAMLTFVVIGAGPTGVELAGALAEIARDTLRHDFRAFDPADATILLIDAADRVLPGYPPDLSAKAKRSLQQLGVTVRTAVRVLEIQADKITLQTGEHVADLAAHTVLWAAGVRASPLGALLARRTACTLDRVGRVLVNPDLTIPNHPEIRVIGDLALLNDEHGRPLPGVADVAMQQGRYAARAIVAELHGRTLPPFRYRHKGSMATIGRAAAVADFGRVRLSGYLAWLAWLFVHLINLIGFQSRLLVLLQWAGNYITHNRAARLITHDQSEREMQPESRSS
ncbi:MAG: NAD(P)/FAD-dependent oxidoreductase [Phycisphaerales bacterium]|nr:NAD(P)/FAD-dependent oxidoreductase [Phycisphaerales bacterium]